jgi:hypothetical protein
LLPLLKVKADTILLGFLDVGTMDNERVNTPIKTPLPNRAAQTGVFDLDIRISNRPFIDISKSFAAETGFQFRNVEKRINAV